MEDQAHAGRAGDKPRTDNPTAFATPPGSLREEVRREAEKVHEAATYSSETQFEYAKRWRSVDRWLGSASTALAGVGMKGP